TRCSSRPIGRRMTAATPTCCPTRTSEPRAAGSWSPPTAPRPAGQMLIRAPRATIGRPASSLRRRRTTADAFPIRDPAKLRCGRRQAERRGRAGRAGEVGMGAQVALRYSDYLRWQAVMLLVVGLCHVVCGIPGVFVHQRDSAMLLAAPIAVVLAGLAGVRRGGSPVRA